MSLENLRSELEKVNQILLTSIINRKSIVKNIQDIKLKKNNILFAPEQEWKIFSSMREYLKQLSLTELFAFSIISENHVQCSGEYPLWSQKAHLSSKQDSIIEKINPIILAQVEPKAAINLNYNEEFDFLKKFIQEKS